ncbi:MAG: helix-turn-helix domain-containing protein [Chlamydiae bacterium]|nr:helix-turn-helix domain-containing protein [Chlamydiota bacterium]
MDLKIKDVAELLNVSETTIRRWLSDGKIPAYRLNHQYRFSRIEIENWMMSCKVEQEKHLSFSKPEQIYPLKNDGQETSSSRSGTQQFGLYRALNKGDVFLDIPGDTKEEVIKNTIAKVAERLSFDAEVVSELFLDRERLMPTALNNGIAIPHSRDFILKGHASDIVVVVFPKKPIEYGALDGKPVHSMFFLFSSDDKKHLHLLAKIAHLSSNQESLRMLEKKPSKEVFLDFLKEWEIKLRT